MRTENYYSLGGFPLVVRSETEALAKLFQQAFTDFEALNFSPAQLSQAYALDVEYCSVLPEACEKMKLCYEGPLLAEGHCHLFSSGLETLCVLESKAALYTNYQESRSVLSVLKGSENSVRGNLAMNALVDVGFAGGQFVVHAAALALPGRRAMVLIHAPSGTGKTTTSLSLLASGFSLGSDDLAFVSTKGQVQAYGLPRSLKVHKNTAAMLPWVKARLADRPWNDEDERPLPLENLKDFSLIQTPEPMPVAALFRLARAPEKSAVVPIGQADMLATLAADNVRIGMSGGMLPIDQNRFASYAQLVKGVPIFELQAGPDLSALGDLVQSVCALPA